MAVSDFIKKYYGAYAKGVRKGAEGVLELEKAVAKGSARFALSAGQAAVELPLQVDSALRGKLRPSSYLAPKKIPGLGVLGPIETYQSEAIRRQNEGGSPLGSILRTGGSVVTDEPIGVGLKPVGIGIGLGIKRFGPKANKLAQEGLELLKNKVSGEEFSVISKGDNYVVQSTKTGEKLNVRASDVAGKFDAVAPRPAKVVQPTAAKAPLKERGFITSAKEVVPDAEKIAGQYIPRETDALAIKAKNLIKDDILKAEQVALKSFGDEAVAVASELIKKYGDDAAQEVDELKKAFLYDKAAEIANTVAPKLTEAGRTVQAASILGRMTPEGQLRFAAREIQRFNETAPLSKKIPELTGEQSKQIITKMKEIQAMPNGREKALQYQKLQENIKSIVPTPLWKKITAVWKAGLLTGLKTTGLNIFSNISHTTSEIAKDAPAAIVDSVASLFTGKRTKTFNLDGLSKGGKEGFEKGLDYLKTGFDERNIGQKLDYNKVSFGEGKVAKAFQTYTDVVFRAMGSADQPFYYGALSRSLMDQALAKGINAGKSGKALKEFAEELVGNPTEEMIRYATADAATAVFQNETYLGKAAKAIQNIPIVGEIVVPFGRTPSAVATQIINYTPVGTAAAIMKQIARKEFDQRLFSEAVGRGLTGTAALYAGYKMFKNDMISLDYPTTEREQKLWELEGRKANSIKIGGKWRSPIVLGPAGNLLLVGGHFGRAYEEEGTPTGALAKAMVGSAKSFTEQTFLTGINSSVNALNDPGRYAESYLGNLVGSVVPTIVSDVARATDPLERRPENVPQRVQARIPGARQNLEPKVDVLGQEIERIGNPLEVMLDPTRPSPAKSTPVIEEFRRLQEAGFGASPTLLGDKAGFKGLSQAENTKLWKMTGQVANDKLENLFASEDYQKLDDDAKKKTIDKFVEKAKVNARAAMALKLTEGLEGKALVDKVYELKEGGLMTKEVYKKFLELR